MLSSTQVAECIAPFLQLAFFVASCKKNSIFRGTQRGKFWIVDMACPVLADIEEKQDRWDGDATFENLREVFRFHIENSTFGGLLFMRRD